MPNSKSIKSIIFYVFIIFFIVLAYLGNSGSLSSLFPKKITIVNKSIIQIEYKEKEYNADYTKKFKGEAIEVSGFEEGEKWKGDYKVDDVNYWEGQSSYVLLARGLVPTILTLRQSMNLSNSTVIKILVYSVDQENTDNIKKAVLRFGNLTDSAYYEYDIRNIKPGWNIIEMQKGNFSFVSAKGEGVVDTNSVENDRLWTTIEKVSIQLDSLPNSQAELSLDRLWAEKNEDYKKEFFTPSSDMLSPKVWNGKSYINSWAMGATLSLIKKISGVKNFTYTVKIIPQKTGTFGINARTDLSTTYGYYFDFGGIGTGSWQLYKIGKVADAAAVTQLDSGSLANFEFEANQPVWLRLKTSGDTIAGYLSTDGENFTKLTEKNDSEHKSGGIGIQTASASFLLESIEFKQ